MRAIEVHVIKFLLMVIAFFFGQSARADQSTLASPPAASELFPAHTWAVQSDGVYIRGVGQPRFEQLSGGQVSLNRYVFNRFAIGAELPLYYVNQTGPNSVIGGFDLLARWHFLEIDRFSIYADGGAGAVFSSHNVPHQGTSYNFTPQVGLGATCMLTPSTYLFGGCRSWHLSNAGFDGVRRNPSIDQAIMGYVGIGWKF